MYEISRYPVYNYDWKCTSAHHSIATIGANAILIALV